MIIKSCAPARIYFGGGGTDIGPYDSQKGGAVLSVAITRYSRGSLTPSLNGEIKLISQDYQKKVLLHLGERFPYNGNLDLFKAAINRMNPPHGLELEVQSDIGPNTGLGGSASNAVAVLGVLNEYQGKRMSKEAIAELAFSLEQDELANIGGRQDQYSAVFGGLNLIEFFGGQNVQVNPLRLKPEILAELKRRLILVYIGPREPSGDILKDQQMSYAQADKIRCLDYLKENVYLMKDALVKGDINKFGRLISDSWDWKKKLHPPVTTERIETLRELGKNNGAIGSRNMGAGRGGHLIFICEDNKSASLSEVLKREGVKIVDFDFDKNGLKVWREE